MSTEYPRRSRGVAATRAKTIRAANVHSSAVLRRLIFDERTSSDVRVDVLDAEAAALVRVVVGKGDVFQIERLQLARLAIDREPAAAIRGVIFREDRVRDRTVDAIEPQAAAAVRCDVGPRGRSSCALD